MPEEYFFEVKTRRGSDKPLKCGISPDGLFCIYMAKKGPHLVVDREEAIEMCQNILGHYAKTWAPPEPGEI